MFLDLYQAIACVAHVRFKVSVPAYLLQNTYRFQDSNEMWGLDGILSASVPASKMDIPAKVLNLLIEDGCWDILISSSSALQTSVSCWEWLKSSYHSARGCNFIQVIERPPVTYGPIS